MSARKGPKRAPPKISLDKVRDAEIEAFARDAKTPFGLRIEEAFRNGAGLPPAAEAAPLPTVKQVNPLSAPRARKFHLVRDDDETGISGKGVVAEGIEFSNGMCAMCWLTAVHSVAVYPNVRQLEAIHGHNGRTRVVFLPPGAA